jgi:hypothetical protein
MQSAPLSPPDEGHSWSSFGDEISSDRALSLRRRWRELSERLLPAGKGDAFWRYSRRRTVLDPAQGWKLHVSATVLNAVDVLTAVAPFLASQNALYKAPRSLRELKKLNAGVYYGYTQIGKFMTIYPPDEAEAVRWAERLHELTRSFGGPLIPFDRRYKTASNVYYRYGAFRINELREPDGRVTLALRDPAGNLVADARDAERACPDWVVDPFAAAAEERGKEDSPLKTDFPVFRAISQRGKGGVFQAIDLKSDRPRFCLVKEGRLHGEVDWDGRDGFWRVRNERQALEALRAAGVAVPEVYAAFVAGGNYYLVSEYLGGETLRLYLKKRKRRLPVARALDFAVRLAETLAKIHEAGWLWRDCKPDNLIVAENSELRPIDFEGACPLDRPDPVVWSTLFADSRLWLECNTGRRPAAGDLFALAAIIYLLVEGELPRVTDETVPVIRRRGTPPALVNLTRRLLDLRSAPETDARQIAAQLAEIRCGLKKSNFSGGPRSARGLSVPSASAGLENAGLRAGRRKPDRR